MESMGQKGKIRPEVAKKIPGFREDIPANEFLDSNEYRYVLAHAGQPKVQKVQDGRSVGMNLEYSGYKAFVYQEPQCRDTGSTSETRDLGFFEGIFSSGVKNKTVNFDNYTCRVSPDKIAQLSAIEERISGKSIHLRTLDIEWSFRNETGQRYNRYNAEEKQRLQKENGPKQCMIHCVDATKTTKTMHFYAGVGYYDVLNYGKEFCKYRKGLFDVVCEQ